MIAQEAIERLRAATPDARNTSRIECFAVAIRELMRDYHVASHTKTHPGFGFAVLRAFFVIVVKP